MDEQHQHSNDDQIDNPDQPSQITIEISLELESRIRTAARHNDLTVDKYLEGILEQAVPDEASLVQRQGRPIPANFLEDVYQVREQVMRDSKGELFDDSTEMIRQMREERTRQLMEEHETTQKRGRPVTREAIERLLQVREKIIQESKGELFEDSAEVIRQMHEERTRQLMGEE